MKRWKQRLLYGSAPLLGLILIWMLCFSAGAGEPGLSAALASDGAQITVTLSGSAAAGGTASVLFPVWSETNGQDDLVWHEAKQSANGDWTASIPLSEHTGYGTYNIHCYQVSTAGECVFYGGITVNVPRVSASATISKTGGTSGSFRVNLGSVNQPGAVKNIDVAVWSRANGQDDLVWYSASRSGDGWYVDVNTQEHGYDDGTYLIHAYVRDTRGGYYVCADTETAVTVDRSKMQFTAVWDARKSVIVATLSGAYTGRDVTGVWFPAWSASNGQDDLVWYSASQNQNGDWTVEIPLSSHKDYGTYNVHCYLQRGTGCQYVEGKTVKVSKVTAKVSAAATGDPSGSFRIELTGLNAPDAVKNIDVAVWSTANGQDDLVWYSARQNGSSWYVDVNTYDHNYDEGSYTIHAYVRDTLGNYYVCGNTKTTVTVDRSKESLTGKWNPAAGTMEIQLSGAYTGRNVTEVLFAVWSKTGGQDDLVWYSAPQNADGSWGLTIPLSNHSGTGDYYIHCYRRTANSLTFEKQYTARVEPCYTTISTQTTDASSGSFRINLTNPTVPDAVKQIDVAVWSEIYGQDDLIWTTATRDGDSWYADVDTGEHLFDDGAYSIHAYVTDNSGNQYCSATAQTTVTVDRGTSATIKTSLDDSRGLLTVSLEGANLGRDVTQVKFPVWTEANGQDDIVWYEAARDSKGIWSAVIDLRHHSYECGTYNVHCYAYVGNVATGMASTTTEITLTQRYQNPSQYYQIQYNISLSGGGYNLDIGYEGLKVAYVKNALGLGSAVGMGGAYYSASMKNAVSSFQGRAGLPQTGVVDLATWQALGFSESQWYTLGAYVSPVQVNFSSTREDCIEAMISRAYDYLGNPFIIGASGPSSEGLDCSGLVMQACYAAGLDLSPINPVRHASPGYEYESRNLYASSRLKKVSLNQRERGDLIFYGTRGVVTHVAIYLGNNQVIESWPNRVMVAPMINSSHSTIIGVGRPFV